LRVVKVSVSIPMQVHEDVLRYLAQEIQKRKRYMSYSEAISEILIEGLRHKLGG